MDGRTWSGWRASAVVIAVAAWSGCGVESERAAVRAELGAAWPWFVVGDPVVTHYDGVDDDLLTAGLGTAGLASPIPPLPENPVAPTPAELRRLAMYASYRGAHDMTEAGGYGRLYGPNVGPDYVARDVAGTVAGTEYVAYAGRARVAMVVQIPDSFDPDAACIVAAASSGVQSVYDPIGRAGDWGLKRGCATVYTDKGGGVSLHDLDSDTVSTLRGVRAPAATAADSASFIADGDLTAYTAERPHRVAYKHMHSRDNPQRTWGRDLLRAVEFAFAAINHHYGAVVVHPLDTLVIAAGFSNGATAALAAAERNWWRIWIDGVVASAPNASTRRRGAPLTVHQGERTWSDVGTTSLEHFALVNLYQHCASATTPFGVVPGRCAGLRARGLLAADTLEAQAAEAQAALNAAGLLVEQNELSHLSGFVDAPLANAVGVATSFSRFGVADELCGYSVGAVDELGQAAPSPAVDRALAWATQALPGAGTWQILNSEAGIVDRFSTPDGNLDGALCLAELATGDGVAPRRARRGQRRALLSANLRGAPAIIVQGRSDQAVAVNHSARAYVGRNRRVEGPGTALSYVEVLRVQHADAALGVPELPYAAFLVPLGVYYARALDDMYAHLRNGAPLPPSQVVPTVPRGIAPDGAVPPLEWFNVPPARAAPWCPIDTDGYAVTVPECDLGG